MPPWLPIAVTLLGIVASLVGGVLFVIANKKVRFAPDENAANEKLIKSRFRSCSGFSTFSLLEVLPPLLYRVGLCLV